MEIKYLLRLDDACPTMDKIKWNWIENLLDEYDIRPMVGVIPNNKDDNLYYNHFDENFWAKVKQWQNKNWVIALHGYDHVCISNSDGINPIHKRSEFAGVPLEIQRQKILNGIEILKKNHIKCDYFFAPSHTFDNNTLKVIMCNSNIRKICDTFSRLPYLKNNMFFYPIHFGKFRQIEIPGYWGFCLHPNNMSDLDFENLNLFLKKNKYRFISHDDIKTENLKSRSYLDKLIQILYFLKRKFY